MAMALYPKCRGLRRVPLIDPGEGASPALPLRQRAAIARRPPPREGALSTAAKLRTRACYVLVSPDLSLKLRRGSSDSRESFYMDFAQGIDSDIEEVTTIERIIPEHPGGRTEGDSDTLATPSGLEENKDLVQWYVETDIICLNDTSHL
ncbi:hypothetical protein ACJJTC_007771 [Scirpophaga incertulas]